jgi:signal transduction histidine kinase
MSDDSRDAQRAEDEAADGVAGTPERPATSDTYGPSHTALEDLLAVIAHEMRAPLTVVCTAAETVAAGHLTAEQLGPLLEVIRRNAELAMLLTDRLSLAREVEAGVFDLEAVALDLADLAAETVADLGPLIAERHVVRVAAQSPVRVVAGETSVREILLNLLLNAAKYSPSGSEIEVTASLDNGDATLAVRDHGPGVPSADTERIFGKYTQVDRMAAGVGLGLYISRGLARANGGDLTVAAAPGGGSVFTFRLEAASAS